MGAGRECRYSGARRGIGSIRGHWASPGGCLGVLGGVRGYRGVLGAGRECRYSEARRGIGSIRGHWGSPRGCWGCYGVLGVSGGVGVSGCIGVTSGLGAQPHLAPVQGPSTPTGSSWGVTYLTKARQGPLLRVPSLPLFSIGE